MEHDYDLFRSRAFYLVLSETLVDLLLAGGTFAARPQLVRYPFVMHSLHSRF